MFTATRAKRRASFGSSEVRTVRLEKNAEVEQHRDGADYPRTNGDDDECSHGSDGCEDDKDEESETDEAAPSSRDNAGCARTITHGDANATARHATTKETAVKSATYDNKLTNTPNDSPTTTPTLTSATTSTHAFNGIRRLLELPARLRAKIYKLVGPDGVLTTINSRCRVPEIWRKISISILEKDVENLYKCDHTYLLVKLDLLKLNGPETSPHAQSLEDLKNGIHPFISASVSRAHNFNIVEELFIGLETHDLQRFDLYYTLRRSQKEPGIPCQSDHEPFVLQFSGSVPESIATRQHLLMSADRINLQTYFQPLEVAVYSLLHTVFAPNLPSASDRCQLARVIGVTNSHPSSPHMYPGLLDLAPGTLSEYMTDFWVAEKDQHEFVCLMYRFRYQCQSIDGDESTKELWLDDGQSLTPAERQNIEGWRAVWEASQGWDLPDRSLNLLWSLWTGTHGCDIHPCKLEKHIHLGEEHFIKVAAEWVNAWDEFRARMPLDAPDAACPSKQSVAIFLAERD